MKTTPLAKYWMIATLGIAISFFLFYLINEIKVQKSALTIDGAVAKTELKITEEIHKIDLVIESMSFFFENTPHISQELFERFTNPFRQDLKGIGALMWAPKVVHDENDLYHQKMPTIKKANASNELVASQPQAIHYPLALINPLKNLKDALGFDNYSEPKRKNTVDEANKSKTMAISAPIKLVKRDNGVPGVLAMKTVFEPNQSDVKGIVEVAYRMDDFFNSTLDAEMNVLDIVITDAAANNQLLFTSFDKGSTSTKAKKLIKIKVANRTWNINIYPKIAYTKFPHTAESYFILAFGLITTVLIVLNLKGRDERSYKLETVVAQRTKALEVSNKQKENLLREIHHRVMNNLQITSSLMNLQKRKLQDEEAIYALSSSQDRINAIALIHQKIYQHDGVDAVDLKGYLENLIKSHKRISPSVQYEIDCPEVFIDLDSAVPLAIITSEIVVNALKHAFTADSQTNMLYILVTVKKNDVLNLVISDNGKGLNKNLDSSKDRGLGYDIIKKLCRQLEADYEYTSSTSGTAFSLSFKQRKLQIPVFA